MAYRRRIAEALNAEELMAAAACASEAEVLRLLRKAGIEPLDRGGGKGQRRLYDERDAVLVRALRRLSEMRCPDVWLAAVGSWWQHPLNDAGILNARYLVVAPSREHSPVFVTGRHGLPEVLAGCHAWVVDLADERVYRRDS